MPIAGGLGGGALHLQQGLALQTTLAVAGSGFQPRWDEHCTQTEPQSLPRRASRRSVGACEEERQPKGAGASACGCPWGCAIGLGAHTEESGKELRPGNKGTSNPVTLPRVLPEQVSIEPLITKINLLLFCSLLHKIVILSSLIASNLYAFPFQGVLSRASRRARFIPAACCPALISSAPPGPRAATPRDRGTAARVVAGRFPARSPVFNTGQQRESLRKDRQSLNQLWDCSAHAPFLLIPITDDLMKS